MIGGKIKGARYIAEKFCDVSCVFLQLWQSVGEELVEIRTLTHFDA